METTPAFKVVIAYETFEAAARARQVSDRLAAELNLECNFWNMDALVHLPLRELAATEAAQADVIVIATHGGEEPRNYVKDWIENWLPRNLNSTSPGEPNAGEHRRAQARGPAGMIATSTDVKKIPASAKGVEREELSASSWRKGQGSLAQTATARAVPTGNETVLLVDCSPMMRGILARVLRQLGYRVVEASGALEAQRLAASCGEIQLLLVDHSAPDRTDMELALWFRAMYPRMKILVACVSLWELNLHVGETQQINFLAKPFTEHELARVVRRVLAH